MAVIIKNEEMPTNCMDCFMRYMCNETRGLSLDDLEKLATQRSKRCPLRAKKICKYCEYYKPIDGINTMGICNGGFVKNLFVKVRYDDYCSQITGEVV